MTFENLNSGLAFKCQDMLECCENTQDEFIRFVPSSALRNEDFRSNHEMGIKPAHDSPEYIALHRGVSIIKNARVTIIRKFSKILRKYEYMCNFKLTQNAGLVSSPNPKSDHCTLFKCDTFNTDDHVLVNAISLARD
jgi:hypothetical protein